MTAELWEFPRLTTRHCTPRAGKTRGRLCWQSRARFSPCPFPNGLVVQKTARSAALQLRSLCTWSGSSEPLWEMSAWAQLKDISTRAGLLSP